MFDTLSEPVQFAFSNLVLDQYSCSDWCRLLVVFPYAQGSSSANPWLDAPFPLVSAPSTRQLLDALYGWHQQLVTPLLGRFLLHCRCHSDCGAPTIIPYLFTGILGSKLSPLISYQLLAS